MAYYYWSICEAFFSMSPAVSALADSALLLSYRVAPAQRDLILGWYLETAGRQAEATRVLEELTRREPKNEDACYQLARLYWFHHGRPADAIGMYEKAISINPQSALAFNDLAYCYQAVGQLEKAVAAARQYIALEPTKGNPYDTLGDIFSTVTPESSEKYWSLACDRDRGFAVSMHKLAAVALHKRQWDRATRHAALERHVERRPGPEPARARAPLRRGTAGKRTGG